MKKHKHIKEIFTAANNSLRQRWRQINQEGFEFANGSQLSEKELKSLREKKMPTFTVDRLTPIIELLEYQATANNPRWMAVGMESSDSKEAAAYAALAEYVWNISDGPALYSQIINNAIVRSIGYMMVTIDKDSDSGLGDIKLEQLDPFDVYPDPASADILFRDASYILIHKALPRRRAIEMFPKAKGVIKKAGQQTQETFFTDRDGNETVDTYIQEAVTFASESDGSLDDIIDYYELYEKEKMKMYNVYYKVLGNPEEIKLIKQQAAIKKDEITKEFAVELEEFQLMLKQKLDSGEIIESRYELELTKKTKEQKSYVEKFMETFNAELEKRKETVENKKIHEKEYEEMLGNPDIANMIVEAIPFYEMRIKQTKTIDEYIIEKQYFPDYITEYPIVPFSWKWTGSVYPISAVSPLVGRQRMINKAEQIMIHNASLGSSLRWKFIKGAVNEEKFSQNAATPGGMLEGNPGYDLPQEVPPLPLNNAFFSISTNAKTDMEYSSGVYASMQGDAQSQHDTYRGMVAVDESGTRRTKRWMKNIIEPALTQVGEVVFQFARALYTTHKIFKIVQPDALQQEEGSSHEINRLLYNDYKEVVAKIHDVQSAQYNIVVVAGSTQPINRWAKRQELLELYKQGIVDDIALLAETDLPNKDDIAKRKSMYSKMQSQLEQFEEKLKDKEGTIETLERQLVQAGIKGKVQDMEMEVHRHKEQAKGNIDKEVTQTKAEQKVLRETVASKVDMAIKDIEREAKDSNKESGNKEKKSNK